MDVDVLLTQLRHSFEDCIHPFVGLEPRDSERPEVAVEAVAGAHLAGVEPRAELLGVGAQGHDSDVLG